MKRGISISAIIILSTFFCTACNDDNEVVTNNPIVVDKDVEKDKNELPPILYENDVFKEVKIEEVDGNVVVKGKARVFEGVFQYAIVAGNEILKEDYYQTDGAPAWGDFSITLYKEHVVKEGAKLELFIYSAMDGSKTDVLEIPLRINNFSIKTRYNPYTRVRYDI